MYHYIHRPIPPPPQIHQYHYCTDMHMDNDYTVDELILHTITSIFPYIPQYHYLIDMDDYTVNQL